LDCDGGGTFTVEQPDAQWLDFDGFPDVVAVHAYHRDGTFGNPAEELVVRDIEGTLLLAYSDRDADSEELEPPWRSSLDPFEFAVSASECEDEISYSCLVCTSRLLVIENGAAELRLLQGDRGELDDWSVFVGRLVECEAECSETYTSTFFRVAIAHDAVLREPPP